jgi:oxygen-independent coproporphyrinogen-3 oxidase
LSTIGAEAGGPKSEGFEHVYVHVPFCGRRCNYCDFAIAVRKQVPSSEFVDAIMAEVVTRGLSESGGNIRSIYFGGGTPSKLDPAELGRLLHGIPRALGVEDLSTIAGTAELTLEANPEDVSAESAKAWRAAGLNRVSLGVQSFDPAVLRWMHRDHSPEVSAKAVQTLRAAGFGSISVDLIFAVPDSLERDWTRDLDQAIALQPDHVSLYGLTVEPHTPLGRWRARGEVEEAPEERYELEFLEASDRLRAEGFEHYEVSNYGRAGHRAVHNSSYWKGVPYLGLGPSAHGFDGSERRWNRSAYVDWLRAVGERADPVEGSERLTPAERIAEDVYLGLRTVDGLAIHQSEVTTVTRWMDAGWAVLEPSSGTDWAGTLRLTPAGWLRLDSIAATLTSLRSPS